MTSFIFCQSLYCFPFFLSQKEYLQNQLNDTVIESTTHDLDPIFFLGTYKRCLTAGSRNKYPIPARYRENKVGKQINQKLKEKKNKNFRYSCFHEKSDLVLFRRIFSCNPATS